MSSTNFPTVSTPQPSVSLSARLKQILLTAFLSFGLVVPSASAKCFSHDLKAPVIVPLAAASVAATAQAPLAASSNSAVSIVGLWNVTFLSAGQVVDVAFDAWHSDGTEILNDYTNPIEGNVCLGVWEQTGPRTYTLKHPSWSFDPSGNLQGTVIIHETVILSADGNSYTGSYTYDIYDKSGAFIEELSGKIKATRIRPD
jgi:hypothetical protein